MADNDYNIIKPVESLYNITGLTAIKQRQQRKRQQNKTNKKEKTKEPAEGGSDPVQPSGLANGSVKQQNSDTEITANADEKHSIDYRA
jgi:hypothetical protein